MAAMVRDVSKPSGRRRNSTIPTWPPNVSERHPRMAAIGRAAAAHPALPRTGGATQRLPTGGVTRRTLTGAWGAASNAMAAAAGGMASAGIK